MLKAVFLKVWKKPRAEWLPECPVLLLGGSRKWG